MKLEVDKYYKTVNNTIIKITTKNDNLFFSFGGIITETRKHVNPWVGYWNEKGIHENYDHLKIIEELNNFDERMQDQAIFQEDETDEHTQEEYAEKHVNDDPIVVDGEEVTDDQKEEDETLKVKFEKSYKFDATWVEILLDFLEHLSREHFKYQIDEYSLLGIVWKARYRKLAKLFDDPEIDNAYLKNTIHHVLDHEFAWHREGERARKTAEKMYEALKPKKYSINQEEDE